VARGNFGYSFTYDAKDVSHGTVDAMNNMTIKLGQMIRELNSGVDTLTTGAGELNQGADTRVLKANN